jgi:hypothetical protein
MAYRQQFKTVDVVGTRKQTERKTKLITENTKLK